MKPKLVKTTLAASLLAGSPLLHAAVIFTDDFSASGTGAWYRGRESGVNPQNNGTLANTGNALVFTENGSGMEEVIGRSFTAQTITVGQTIRLTLDYSQSGPASIIRFGLYDVTNPIAAHGWGNLDTLGAWQGYTTFVRDSNSSGNVARRENGSGTTVTLGPTSGTGNASNPTVTVADITSPANNTNFNTVNNTVYQVLFEVTRTSTGMDTLLTLTSGITEHFRVTGTTTTVYDTFDTVFLRQGGGSAAPATYDNIQVSIIPEPSAALLGGLGLLALLRRRR